MELIEVTRDNCVGCRLCEMACSLYHESECSTARSRIKVFRNEEFGDNLISLCNQCASPRCVESCTSLALTRDEATGIVTATDRYCVGCGDCVEACPLGAIFLGADGIAVKCDLCGGDPECVKCCPRGTLTLKEVDAASPHREAYFDEMSRLLRERQLLTSAELSSRVRK